MMWFAFSFVIAKFKHKIFVFSCIFYSILDIEFHIDVSFHENIFKMSQFFKCSIARFTIRFYVIFKINKLSNFDSFVFAIFALIYNFDQIISRWKSLFENFKQYIVEKITSLKKLHRWKNYIVEKICTKILN